VLEVLRHRLADVENGAELSTGDPAAAAPSRRRPRRAVRRSRGAAAQANNQPLRHGVAGQTPNGDVRGR
jgi:hypothetical protein